VLSRHKEILGKYYRIPTPSWDVIRNVYIKKDTYKVAEKNGILIPKLYDVNNMEQLMEADVQYPLVLKPSISHRFYGKTRIKAFRIDNKEELLKAYRRVSDIIDTSEILVQDFIPGGPKNLYSFCSFFKNGKVIAGLTARRARQRPMDFGLASTYVELVDIPELRSISEKFLSLINYYGFAEVEFMYDPRDRQYKLLEVNPRIWAWHALAIAAGVDMPYLLYQDMIGEEIVVPDSIKQVKWIRLITDIPTALSEIAKGNLKMSDYIASMKGKKVDAVLSFTDPLPFFVEIALILYRRLKSYISHNV
jgi:predicted ATP-grasp superfamily ATP-dependent carboligase